MIYDNHSGSGQKYLKLPSGGSISVKKAWGKPDIIIDDKKDCKLLILEGEKKENIQEGIDQLSTFDKISEFLLEKYNGRINFMIKSDKKYTAERYVVIFSPDTSNKVSSKVIFSINKEGKIKIHENCPLIIKESLKEIIKS